MFFDFFLNGSFLIWEWGFQVVETYWSGWLPRGWFSEMYVQNILFSNIDTTGAYGWWVTDWNLCGRYEGLVPFFHDIMLDYRRELVLYTGSVRGDLNVMMRILTQEHNRGLQNLSFVMDIEDPYAAMGTTGQDFWGY